MKIGIDARFYHLEGQGLGRYTKELVNGLCNLDKQNKYVIFFSQNATLPNLPSNFQARITRIPWYGLNEQLRWPLIIKKEKLDLMHFVHFNVPLSYNLPYVVTIHDLILWHHDSSKISTRNPLYFKIKYTAYKAIIRHAIRGAQYVIAVSKFTAQDVVKELEVKYDKISVIYNGADPESFQAFDTHLTIKLPKQYLLYVGNAYPHKNLNFLIDTFHDWVNQSNNVDLVLVGKKDIFYQRLLSDIRKRKLKRIMILTDVNDSMLATIYEKAHAYVFPSLYEGFGMPPLEAMRFGVPVLASQCSSLPEILGDAAIYFELSNKSDLLSKLDTITKNDELRQKLVDKGKRQSARYTWDDCVQETLNLYRKHKN